MIRTSHDLIYHASFPPSLSLCHVERSEAAAPFSPSRPFPLSLPLSVVRLSIDRILHSTCSLAHSHSLALRRNFSSSPQSATRCISVLIPPVQKKTGRLPCPPTCKWLLLKLPRNHVSEITCAIWRCRMPYSKLCSDKTDICPITIM